MGDGCSFIPLLGYQRQSYQRQSQYIYIQKLDSMFPIDTNIDDNGGKLELLSNDAKGTSTAYNITTLKRIWMFFFSLLLVALISFLHIPSTSSVKLLKRHKHNQNNLVHSSSSIPTSSPSTKELTSFLHFAYAAFCPDEPLVDWDCEWCQNESFQVTALLFNETTKTRGFVGFDPSQNLIVASYRGSHGNMANWILDLEPGTTRDFYGVTVRTGWWHAYRAIRGQLLVALQEIHTSSCPSCTRLLTTGHSLGAALSGMTALDVKLAPPTQWIESVQMVNFGMPRVGHKDFSTLFQKHVDSSFRVVHFEDLVPRYPLRVGASPEAYHHVGTELWEPQRNFNGILKECNGSGEDPACSDSLPPWHWNPNDHMTYLGVLNDNCGT